MSKEKDTAPIRVFGLSRFETETLRQIALKKYGKASVSLLAKKALQSMLEAPAPPPEKTNRAQHPAANRRITVRLPAADRSYLLRLAEVRKGTVNDAVRDIIHMYIGQHSVLTAAAEHSQTQPPRQSLDQSKRRDGVMDMDS